MKNYITAGLAAFAMATATFMSSPAQAQEPAQARLGVQSVAVKGVLTCNGAPAANVRVTLFDNDGGIDPDDQLATTRTDAQGHFTLSGSTSELTRIDPKFTVYHDCNDGIIPCHRAFSTSVPASYVTDGATPKKTFDAGTIELGPRHSGETRDCLH